MGKNRSCEIKKKSMEAGALGGGISGSGPSLFMLSKNEATAIAVEESMKKAVQNCNIDFHTHVTTISTQGVRVQ